MITNMFAVYDTKALCYGAPFFMPSVGSAVRAFGDLANDKQSSINRHPTDYILMHIGCFDDNNAKIVSYDVPKNLGLASDYIDVVKPTFPDKYDDPSGVVRGALHCKTDKNGNVEVLKDEDYIKQVEVKK